MKRLRVFTCLTFLCWSCTADVSVGGFVGCEILGVPVSEVRELRELRACNCDLVV